MGMVVGFWRVLSREPLLSSRGRRELGDAGTVLHRDSEIIAFNKACQVDRHLRVGEGGSGDAFLPCLSILHDVLLVKSPPQKIVGVDLLDHYSPSAMAATARRSGL